MSEMLARIRGGELPDHALEAVVKGIVPLEAEELIEALFVICSEKNGLLDQARETFEGMPDGIKKTFFENKGIDSGILDFYLTSFPLPKEAMTVMLLNPMTRGNSIQAAAPSIAEDLIDLVVNNQVKILEEPGIIEALRENPGLGINHKQKLEEYERLLLKSDIDSAEELATKSIKEIEEEAIADAKAFVQTFGKEKGGAILSSKAPGVAKAESQESPDKVMAPVAEKVKEKISVLEQIASMTIPQKIQAAIKGDREVRSVLIRESNKQVCTAVIKSPRITEAEVEFYANLRNVQTDVLRLIAGNREWVKNYKVVHNLVKNPRTPVTFTTRLLSRLNKRDLKNLVRDRGVPEVLRTMAKRMSRSAT